MRVFLSIWIAVAATAAFAAPDEIYLLIGQSNMAGRAAISSEIAGPLPDVSLWNADGKWEAAKNPLNRYSTIRKGLGMQKLGPGYGFAREMTRGRKLTVGLVVNAKGGSKIDHWKEGGHFYKEAVKRTKAAVAAGGTLKGICWHQGEGNSNDPDYLKKLSPLVAAFRRDLGNENLPFVVGETCKAKSERPVNALLRQAPEEIARTACASSDGLSAYDGNTHFDTKSQLELGKRYAEKMLALLRAE